MKWWNYFFVYAILGHLFETIINLFFGGESGILYGFWTPIYGIGCLTILGLYYSLKKIKYPFVSLFILSALTLSLFEWVGGNFLERFAGEVLWDYSALPWSIGRYVSVPTAIIWGFLAIFFVKYVQPIILKFEYYLPKWWTISLIILLFCDLFWTILMKFMV